jgi:hypothetical protein
MSNNPRTAAELRCGDVTTTNGRVVGTETLEDGRVALDFKWLGPHEIDPDAGESGIFPADEPFWVIEPAPAPLRDLLRLLNARLGSVFTDADPITNIGLAENAIVLLDYEPYEGNRPELAETILAATQYPLAGTDDPAEVAEAKLAGVLDLPKAELTRLLDALLTQREQTGPRRIDLAQVAGLLAARGVPVVIEDTGGGVATLYAGKHDGGHYVAAAGPGHFDRGLRRPVAFTGELSVGADEGAGVLVPGDADEARVADLIAQVDREHPAALPDLPRCPNCGECNWKVDDEVTVRVALQMGDLHRAWFDRAGGDPVRLPQRPQGSVECFTCAYRLEPERSAAEQAELDAPIPRTANDLAMLEVVWAYAQRMVGDPDCEWEVLHDYRRQF